MQVSIGRSHQPPVLCQAAWTVLLELLVCPPTRMPLQCKATLDRDISMHSIDGAFRPRGPRQGPHGATSSWPRMAGSWVNRESKTHKSKSCARHIRKMYLKSLIFSHTQNHKNQKSVIYGSAQHQRHHTSLMFSGVQHPDVRFSSGTTLQLYYLLHVSVLD